jgi:gamma-glutamyl phosphate reductase
MTVHEALVEIKTNIRRISSAIMSTTFCFANRQNAKKVNGVDLDVFRKEVKSNFDSVLDLIRRTDAMKKAISLSNASTYVTVGDERMSVAEALYAMKDGCGDKERLIMQMTSQLTNARNLIESENGDKLDQKLENFINASYGSKDKINSSEIEALSETFRTNNSFVLIDPVNVSEQIKKLQAEVDKFRTNVDSALQISNATTFIEFDY